MPATKYQVREIGTGGAFTVPDVEDGEYAAFVHKVKETQGTWEGETYDQYIVEYALSEIEDDENGQPITLAQFIRIPAALQTDGVLNNESNLYYLLEALGYDMSDLTIDPDEWIGKPVRIVVKNKKLQQGKNAGQVRPRITQVMAPRTGKRSAAPKRQQQDDDDF